MMRTDSNPTAEARSTAASPTIGSTLNNFSPNDASSKKPAAASSSNSNSSSSSAAIKYHSSSSSSHAANSQWNHYAAGGGGCTSSFGTNNSVSSGSAGNTTLSKLRATNKVSPSPSRPSHPLLNEIRQNILSQAIPDKIILEALRETVDLVTALVAVDEKWKAHGDSLIAELHSTQAAPDGKKYEFDYYSGEVEIVDDGPPPIGSKYAFNHDKNDAETVATGTAKKSTKRSSKRTGNSNKGGNKAMKKNSTVKHKRSMSKAKENNGNSNRGIRKSSSHSLSQPTKKSKSTATTPVSKKTPPVIATTKPKKGGGKRKRDVVDVVNGDDAKAPIIPGFKRKYYAPLSGNTATNLPELFHSEVDGNFVDYQFLAKGRGTYAVRVCGEVRTVEDDDGSTVFDTNSLSVSCSCPSFQGKQAPVKNGKLVVCKHLVAALDSVADDSKDSTAMQQPSSSTPRSKRARKSSTRTTSQATSHATQPSKTDEELYIPKVQSHHNGPLLQQLLKDGYGVNAMDGDGNLSLVEGIRNHLTQLNIECSSVDLLGALGADAVEIHSIPATFINYLSSLAGSPVSLCVIDLADADLRRTWYNGNENERAECCLFLSMRASANGSNHFDAIVRLPEGDEVSLPYKLGYNERPPIKLFPDSKTDAAADSSPFSAESMRGGPKMGSHIPPDDWEEGDYPECCKNIHRAWIAFLKGMKQKGIKVSSLQWFRPWLPWFAGPSMKELDIKAVVSLILNYCPSAFGKLCRGGGHPASQLNSDGTLCSDSWGVLSMVLPDFWFYPKVNRIPFFYPYRGKPTDVVTAKHYEIIKESYNVFLKVLLDTSDKVGLMSKAVMEAMQANFSKNLLAKKVVGYSEKETMQNALMHPEMLHNPQLQLSQSFTASACETNDRIYTEISSTSGEHAPCTFCIGLHNNLADNPMFQLMQANKEKVSLDWKALRDGNFYLIDAEGWHEIMKSGRRSIFAGKVKAYNAKHPHLTPTQAARKVAIEEGTDKGVLDWYVAVLERSKFADKVKAYNAKHPHLTPTQAARKVAIEEGTDKGVLDWYVAVLEWSKFADKVKAYNIICPDLTPIQAAKEVAIEEGTDKGLLDWYVAILEKGEARSEFADKVKAYNIICPDLTRIQAAKEVAIEEGTDKRVLDWYVAILEKGEARSEFADKVKAYNAKHSHLTPIQAAKEVAIEEGTDKRVLDWYVAVLEESEARSEFTDKVRAYHAENTNLTLVEASHEVATNEGTTQGVLNWHAGILGREANYLRRDAKIHGTEETIDLFCGACEVAGKEFKVKKNKAASEKKLSRKHICRRVGCAAEGIQCRFYSKEDIENGALRETRSGKKVYQVKAEEGDISHTPTWRKWIRLSRGKKLTYSCVEFIKGKDGHEERLKKYITTKIKYDTAKRANSAAADEELAIAAENRPSNNTVTNNAEVPRVARLSKCPRTLHALWNEWEVGSATQKPVRLWTAQERGAEKHSIFKRKFLWEAVSELVRAGHNAQAACDMIYSVYGEGSSVTKILDRLRADAKTGGHPQLRP